MKNIKEVNNRKKISIVLILIPTILLDSQKFYKKKLTLLGKIIVSF